LYGAFVSKPADKPEPPAPNECCENGCDPCVWDIYREALDDWNALQKSQEEDKNTSTD